MLRLKIESVVFYKLHSNKEVKMLNVKGKHCSVLANGRFHIQSASLHRLAYEITKCLPELPEMRGSCAEILKYVGSKDTNVGIFKVAQKIVGKPFEILRIVLEKNVIILAPLELWSDEIKEIHLTA